MIDVDSSIISYIVVVTTFFFLKESVLYTPPF